ncbi:hypothetical protein [Celeribacter naphthalenivorans]|uniref:hypothetical protein n=1 Tax=Celeribacter naphthalenivorans TaxID=1614694 RepID=UPI001CFBFAE2|nr:hypothetical protein [Celeribacter naphthalenivorans]
MAHIGFYHPDRGYWQATSNPSEEVRATYPEGTVQVPLKPGADYHWQDGEWVFVVPAPPAPADLSPARFAWLLAYTGLGDVWEAMEAATKDTDRATYAALVARRASRFFTLADTLVAVTLFAPLAAQVAPEVDLSEAAIRAAWAQAETAVI